MEYKCKYRIFLKQIWKNYYKIIINDKIKLKCNCSFLASLIQIKIYHNTKKKSAIYLLLNIMVSMKIG